MPSYAYGWSYVLTVFLPFMDYFGILGIGFVCLHPYDPRRYKKFQEMYSLWNPTLRDHVRSISLYKYLSEVMSVRLLHDYARLVMLINR